MRPAGCARGSMSTIAIWLSESASPALDPGVALDGDMGAKAVPRERRFLRCGRERTHGVDEGSVQPRQLGMLAHHGDRDVVAATEQFVVVRHDAQRALPGAGNGNGVGDGGRLGAALERRQHRDVQRPVPHREAVADDEWGERQNDDEA